MKQALNDDTQVQALCERLGAWPAITASIAAGHSGVVAVGAWVIGYFSDGLAAIETSDPLEQVGVVSENGKNRTLSMRGGWYPAL